MGDPCSIIVIAIALIVVILFSAKHHADSRISARSSELEQLYKKSKQQLDKREIELNKRAASIALRAREVEDIKDEAERIVETAQQTYPWLASQVADFHYLHDENTAEHLRRKSRPAIKAAEEVKRISKEKRVLQAKCKEQEYQLAYYEALFPWLEEFKEVPPIVGWEYAQATGPDRQDEYESLRQWLSPEEYSSLSISDKYQLALDRYKKRRKSDWEVGIEYERFVGYKYEMQGYKVRYHGALMGKRDMGRDLIAVNGKRRLVIQCKRWAAEKEIHENHVFQLYGSAVQLTVESEQNYTPVFITTTKLSDVARQCAIFLNIELYECFAYEDYPVIKCNISSSGEKIYHLPFDQQYDRVRIIPSNGEVYASTVAEAEKLGFRRAHRWRDTERKGK